MTTWSVVLSFQFEGSCRRFLSHSLLALAFLGWGLGCGYRPVDRMPRNYSWAKKGETISLPRFRNTTPRLGIEDIFTQALTKHIVAASPWTLVKPGLPARWILQGTLERFESRPLGLTISNQAQQSGQNPKQAGMAAGNASRVEIVIVASAQLLDGQTGAVVASRRGMSFANQYRVEQNFNSFDNRELQVIEGLADDFADSFLTQFLEGMD